jgi:hypothetical protein
MCHSSYIVHITCCRLNSCVIPCRPTFFILLQLQISFAEIRYRRICDLSSLSVQTAQSLNVVLLESNIEKVTVLKQRKK